MEVYSSFSKSEIRKIFKSKRFAIKNKSSKSKRIIRSLLSLEEFIRSTSILLYFSSLDEVATHELILQLLQSQKQVYIPSTREIKITLIKDTTRLYERIPGIKEPERPSVKLPPIIDLAILPGLAFDRSGYRIGYGGGWYDKLLEKLEIKTIVGLCFQEQLVKSLPAEGYDKPVDLIVTDMEVIRVK